MVAWDRSRAQPRRPTGLFLRKRFLRMLWRAFSGGSTNTSDNTILVLGATGATGGEVAKQLIGAGHRPRLLIRNPDKARPFQGKAVLHYGDYKVESDLKLALEGIDKVYLVSALSLDSSEDEINIIDAAKQAGVRHIVKLSVVTAGHPEIVLARLHAATEKHLRDSGLAWTMLRPGNFHSNALLMWSQTIESQNAFYQAAGDGKWASIDPADIGAVAVQALPTPGHESKFYTLTGDELLSASEYAAKLSEALGRTISFIDIPMSAASEGILSAGVSPAYAQAAIELMTAMQQGRWTEISTEFQTLTGRAPTTFLEWVKRNRAAFN